MRRTCSTIPGCVLGRMNRLLYLPMEIASRELDSRLLLSVIALTFMARFPAAKAKVHVAEYCGSKVLLISNHRMAPFVRFRRWLAGAFYDFRTGT